MTRLRKTLAILLLLCITVPVIGSYCWLSYEKHQVRKTVKKQLIDSIDRSQLVRLSFSRQQSEQSLSWEHSKEFEFDGEMYDVVATEAGKDSVTYWCWWDHEETTLNKKLAALVSDLLDKSPDRHRQNEKLVDFFKGLYYMPPADVACTSHRLRTLYYPQYSSPYCSVGATPTNPPPETV